MSGEGFLEWHAGTHDRQEHDGYRSHAHSINGALTIDPHDTGIHLEGGTPFKGDLRPRQPRTREELQRLIRGQESMLMSHVTFDTRPITALRAELADLELREPLEAPAPIPGMAALRIATEAAMRHVSALQRGARKAQRVAVEHSGLGARQHQDEYHEGQADMAGEVLAYLAGVLEQLKEER